MKDNNWCGLRLDLAKRVIKFIKALYGTGHCVVVSLLNCSVVSDKVRYSGIGVPKSKDDVSNGQSRMVFMYMRIGISTRLKGRLIGNTKAYLIAGRVNAL